MLSGFLSSNPKQSSNSGFPSCSEGVVWMVSFLCFFLFVSDHVCLYECRNYGTGLCGEIPWAVEMSNQEGMGTVQTVFSADKNPNERGL